MDEEQIGVELLDRKLAEALADPQRFREPTELRRLHFDRIAAPTSAQG